MRALGRLCHPGLARCSRPSSSTSAVSAALSQFKNTTGTPAAGKPEYQRTGVKSRWQYEGPPKTYDSWGRQHIVPHGPPIVRADFFANFPQTRERTKQSVRTGLIGMKCGMSQIFTKWGERKPVTIIEIQEVQVTQVKTPDREGFWALQLGAGWQKPRRVLKSRRNHFERQAEIAGVDINLKRYCHEFKVTEDAMLPLGTHVNVQHFVPGQYVDVSGITKGKGTAGVMKRWGFAGQPASHGNSKKHRHAGSMGGGTNSRGGGRIHKGKKMAGRMGNKKSTMLNMQVLKIDPEKSLLYLHGCVPGPKGGVLKLRDAFFLHKHEDSPFPTWLEGDPPVPIEMEPTDEDPLAKFYAE